MARGADNPQDQSTAHLLQRRINTKLSGEKFAEDALLVNNDLLQEAFASNKDALYATRQFAGGLITAEEAYLAFADNIEGEVVVDDWLWLKEGQIIGSKGDNNHYPIPSRYLRLESKGFSQEWLSDGALSRDPRLGPARITTEDDSTYYQWWYHGRLLGEYYQGKYKSIAGEELSAPEPDRNTSWTLDDVWVRAFAFCDNEVESAILGAFENTVNNPFAIEGTDYADEDELLDDISALPYNTDYVRNNLDALIEKGVLQKRETTSLLGARATRYYLGEKMKAGAWPREALRKETGESIIYSNLQEFWRDPCDSTLARILKASQDTNAPQERVESVD